MKYFQLDLKSGTIDLFSTDAPAEKLKEAENYVENLDKGVTAEAMFIDFLRLKGYKVNFVTTISETDIYIASNEKF